MRKSILTFVALALLGGALASCGGNTSSVAPTTSGTGTEGTSEKTSSTPTTSSNSNFDVTKAIKVYTRDGTSGTREAFTEKIGISAAKNTDDLLVSGAVTVQSNGDMMTKVAADEYGIGYASLDGLEGNDQLKGLKVEGVTASNETVLDGSFKLQRNFNYIVAKTYSDPIKGALVQSYVDFMLKSSEGLDAVQSKGGILSQDILNAAVDWNDMLKDTTNYPWVKTLGLSESGSSNAALKDITVKFGGSTSVEAISEAVGTAWATNFGSNAPKMNHDHKGSGAAANGIADGSLDIAFASRDFSEDEKAKGTTGFICKDAVVPVVNAKNPVLDDITIKQLRDIYFRQSAWAVEGGSNYNKDYKGETQITTWNQLSK